MITALNDVLTAAEKALEARDIEQLEVLIGEFNDKANTLDANEVENPQALEKLLVRYGVLMKLIETERAEISKALVKHTRTQKQIKTYQDLI